jgi:hypothetical protein
MGSKTEERPIEAGRQTGSRTSPFIPQPPWMDVALCMVSESECCIYKKRGFERNRADLRVASAQHSHDQRLKLRESTLRLRTRLDMGYYRILSTKSPEL